MKDEKAKYLFVEADKMTKQLYRVEKIPIFNYFDKIYHYDKNISVQEIFEKNNIPKEFQKIIIKINLPIFLKHEAEEYIMGFPFDITAGIIEKRGKEKYISVSNYPLVYDHYTFKNKIYFRTKLKYYQYKDIILFLKEIQDKGYLESYLKSIKEAFDVSIDLNCLLQSWNEEKNIKKTLTRYKQQFPIKKY